MNRLEVSQLVKRFGRGAAAVVDGVSFELAEGRVHALVGESGSGKTTVLRLLAGLERPDAGTVRLDGVEISSAARVLAAEKRGIGMVFQHHELFPHLTVARNIAFGLRKLERRQRQQRVAALLDLVGLRDFGARFPHQLSGGERQRVALARALAPEPRLLLLDEPFSSLDTRLRQTVRNETRRILREWGATALFVTHDTQDALSIADEIVVLRGGKVQQQGSAAEVYHAPANSYVASFFGGCNFLPLGSLKHPSGARIRCEVGPPLRGGQREAGLWVRPEDLELLPVADAEAAASDGLRGRVSRVEFQGSHQEVVLACVSPAGEEFEVTVWHQRGVPAQVGESWQIVPRVRG